MANLVSTVTRSLTDDVAETAAKNLPVPKAGGGGMGGDGGGLLPTTSSFPNRGLPNRLRLGKPKAGVASEQKPLQLTAASDKEQALGRIVDPRDVLMKEQGTRQGAMGSVVDTTGVKINPKLLDGFKDGSIKLPANTTMEGGVVYDVKKGRSGNPQKVKLEGEALRKRLLQSKTTIAAAAGVGLVATAAAVTGDGTPAADADPAAALDGMSPPADSKDPTDQLMEESANAFKERQQGKPRYTAGIARESEFRAIAGLVQVPSNKQAITNAIARAEQLEAGLTPEQKEYYNTQLNNARSNATDLFTRLEKIRNAELDERKKNDMFMALGESLELLGNGLTRVFAANYGLRKGVDMSGIRFDRYDWARAQERMDKRYEYSLSQLDAQMQEGIKGLAKTEGAIIESQTKVEDRMFDQASDARKEASMLTRDEQSAQARAAGDRASIIAQGVRHADEMDYKYANMEAMSARHEAAKALREAGKLDKAALMESKNLEQAVNALNATIDEVVPVDSTEITDKDYQEIMKRLGASATQADLKLDEIIPALREPSSFFGFVQGRMNKDEFRQKLRQLRPSGGSSSTAPASSGSMNIEFSDEIPNLD